MRIIMGVIIALMLTTLANADDMVLKSASYKNNEKIPVLYTCDGKNIPPQLSWKSPPPNTQAFALILTSPDAPVGLFYNWVVYNIPSEVTELPEYKDLPDGSLIGNNSIGDPIYRGPCPPDAQIHHYVFTLYALDRKLMLPSEADLDEVLPEIKKHTIESAEIVGTYNH